MFVKSFLLNRVVFENHKKLQQILFHYRREYLPHNVIWMLGNVRRTLFGRFVSSIWASCISPINGHNVGMRKGSANYKTGGKKLSSTQSPRRDGWVISEVTFDRIFGNIKNISQLPQLVQNVKTTAIQRP